MGQTTKISWAEGTWNPWHGCRKISPGCKHCYMFRDKARYGQDPNVVVRSKTTFSDPLTWKLPTLIFTCSWSDWFIEEADRWREEAYDVIRATRHHTYQILTKRDDRIAAHWPGAEDMPNAWLGVSIESAKYKYRIDTLREIPAAVRFLSIEPLLEDIGEIDLRGIGWVIVGGESGSEARPMHPDWARGVRDQCIAAGVPFHFKQRGEWSSTGPHNRSVEISPSAIVLQENQILLPAHPDGGARTLLTKIGKKSAGRELDGRTWDEMPASYKPQEIILSV